MDVRDISQAGGDLPRPPPLDIPEDDMQTSIAQAPDHMGQPSPGHTPVPPTLTEQPSPGQPPVPTTPGLQPSPRVLTPDYSGQLSPGQPPLPPSLGGQPSPRVLQQSSASAGQPPVPPLMALNLPANGNAALHVLGPIQHFGVHPQAGGLPEWPQAGGLPEWPQAPVMPQVGGLPEFPKRLLESMTSRFNKCLKSLPGDISKAAEKLANERQSMLEDQSPRETLLMQEAANAALQQVFQSVKQDHGENVAKQLEQALVQKMPELPMDLQKIKNWQEAAQNHLKAVPKKQIPQGIRKELDNFIKNASPTLSDVSQIINSKAFKEMNSLEKKKTLEIMAIRMGLPRETAQAMGVNDLKKMIVDEFGKQEAQKHLSDSIKMIPEEIANKLDKFINTDKLHLFDVADITDSTAFKDMLGKDMNDLGAKKVLEIMAIRTGLPIHEAQKMDADGLTQYLTNQLSSQVIADE